jgi:hypothetical protein
MSLTKNEMSEAIESAIWRVITSLAIVVALGYLFFSHFAAALIILAIIVICSASIFVANRAMPLFVSLLIWPLQKIESALRGHRLMRGLYFVLALPFVFLRYAAAESEEEPLGLKRTILVAMSLGGAIGIGFAYYGSMALVATYILRRFSGV